MATKEYINLDSLVAQIFSYEQDPDTDYMAIADKHRVSMRMLKDYVASGTYPLPYHPSILVCTRVQFINTFGQNIERGKLKYGSISGDSEDSH